ncbi:MAG: hypothetical protein J7L34_00820 [Thermotogaceae bacterium]|nr:hypothetical protein [Thermotogaceae bacterium]
MNVSFTAIGYNKKNFCHEKVILMISGKSVVLKPLTLDDCEIIGQVVNNLSVKKYLRNVLPESSESWKEKIEKMYACKYPTEIHFGIVVESKIVGIISLEGINWISRNAYITLAIYEENLHGK